MVEEVGLGVGLEPAYKTFMGILSPKIPLLIVSKVKCKEGTRILKGDSQQ
jgi:hypothetical protein